LSNHYKLLPVDLRDVKQLDTILSLAQLDPRYMMKIFLIIIVD